MPSFGLLKRKEIWVPTLRGWLLLLGTVLLLGVGFVLEAVPFLAPVHPLHGGILVVEGWLPDYALAEAGRLFEKHAYRLLITTGVPIDQGFFIASQTNYAQLAATTLAKLGVPGDRLVTVACPTVPRNRTYATAKRVRAWLDANRPAEPVDVFTLGVHARRTWLLYAMALGKRHPAGIIAGEDQRYDKDRWWTTSSGVRTVTSEVIAYLYAKLLFFPNGAEARESG